MVASRRLGALQLAAAALRRHGSVSTHALQLAPCPVLVLPQRTLEVWARQLRLAAKAASLAQEPEEAQGGADSFSSPPQKHLSSGAGVSSDDTPMTPPASKAQMHHPLAAGAGGASPMTPSPDRRCLGSASPPPGAVPSKDTTVAGGGLPPRALLQKPDEAMDAVDNEEAEQQHLRVHAGGPLHPGEQLHRSRDTGEIYRPPGGWPPGATTLSDV